MHAYMRNANAVMRMRMPHRRGRRARGCIAEAMHRRRHCSILGRRRGHVSSLVAIVNPCGRRPALSSAALQQPTAYTILLCDRLIVPC